MLDPFARPRVPLSPLLLLAVLCACGGPLTLKERTANGERRSDEAAVLLSQAERELQALEPERALPLLGKAEEQLAHPDVELSPEVGLLRSQLEELRGAVGRVREERARRALEAQVEAQRDRVVEARQRLAEAVERLEAAEAGLPQVEAVKAAVLQLRERLQEGKALEAQDPNYAASTRSTEQRLPQAEAVVRRAERRLQFISGPLAARSAALALEAQARSNRAQRAELLGQALERYQSCLLEAGRLLAEAPELEQRPFPTEKGTSSAKALAAGCRARAEALQRTVSKLKPVGKNHKGRRSR